MQPLGPGRVSVAITEESTVLEGDGIGRLGRWRETEYLIVFQVPERVLIWGGKLRTEFYSFCFGLCQIR